MDLFKNFLKTDISGEVISSLIVMGIICILAIIVGIKASRQDPLKKPKGILLLAEIGVEYFDNFVTELAGNKLPGMGGFIMALAIYLFLAFIFGLTGLPSPVTNMAIPLSLGCTAFLGIHIISIRFTKWKYFKRYVDPFPVFLPINLISMWAPLLSLTMRLFGNAIAGYTLMSLLYSSLSSLSQNIFSALGEWGGVILPPMITWVLHLYFDLFSALIQTIVYISLTTIFIGQEVPDDEEMETVAINNEIQREGGK